MGGLKKFFGLRPSTGSPRTVNSLPTSVTKDEVKGGDRSSCCCVTGNPALMAERELSLKSVRTRQRDLLVEEGLGSPTMGARPTPQCDFAWRFSEVHRRIPLADKVACRPRWSRASTVEVDRRRGRGGGAPRVKSSTSSPPKTRKASGRLSRLVRLPRAAHGGGQTEAEPAATLRPTSQRIPRFCQRVNERGSRPPTPRQTSIETQGRRRRGESRSRFRGETARTRYGSDPVLDADGNVFELPTTGRPIALLSLRGVHAEGRFGGQDALEESASKAAARAGVWRSPGLCERCAGGR